MAAAAPEDQEFDPYHVPQQRRRDKLRLQSPPTSTFLPIYHHSSSDFLSDCLPPTTRRSIAASTVVGGAAGCGTLVKEELFGGNFMGSSSTCVGGGGNNNLIYMDPRSSSSTSSSSTINPNTSFQENPPFLYNPQNLRLLNACHNIHGLSLSLSTHQQQQQQQQSGGGGGGGNLPLELNLQNYVEHDSSSIYSGKIGTYGDLSRNLIVPLGPFTGYASVLKGSRYLRPAEQLLEEICEGIIYVDKMMMMSSDHFLEDHQSSTAMMLENINVGGGRNVGDQGRNKSRLMSMLNEVYKRYKHYCQQMQAVVSSFESVAGVKNAAPFASMALKAMSKHFSSLRNAISDQLQFLSEPQTHDNNIGAHVAQEKDTSPPGFDTSSAVAAATGMLDFVQHQPVWRPQRGLPERAVTILRAWLFDHFLHPYPTDTDKMMLAKQTGLSRNQVSNWFINARVRLWKPMVEEIHMLETRQAQKSSDDKEKDHLVQVSSMKTPSTSTQRIQDISLKRARKDMTVTVVENPMDRNYVDELSSLPHLGSGGGNGGVSLTLGLEQNNGITRRLADPFSLSAARRLGLVDPNGEEYHVGGGGSSGWH